MSAEELWLAYLAARPERGLLDLFDFVRHTGDVQTTLLMAVKEAGAEGTFRRYLGLILPGRSAHESLDEIGGR